MILTFIVLFFNLIVHFSILWYQLYHKREPSFSESEFYGLMNTDKKFINSQTIVGLRELKG